MHDTHSAPGDSAAPPPDVLAPRTPFNPSPAATDALISAIASDFNSSLAGLAEEYGTTLESLTIWMTRPDIAERLDALQSACAARVRLVASNFLPLAVETLRSVLADFRDLHCNAPCDTSSPRAMATRARAAENARRAASTLLRLAHYSPRGSRAPLDRRPATAPTSDVAPSRMAPISLTVRSPHTPPPAGAFAPATGSDPPIHSVPTSVPHAAVLDTSRTIAPAAAPEARPAAPADAPPPGRSGPNAGSQPTRDFRLTADQPAAGSSPGQRPHPAPARHSTTPPVPKAGAPPGARHDSPLR